MSAQNLNPEEWQLIKEEFDDQIFGVVAIYQRLSDQQFIAEKCINFSSLEEYLQALGQIQLRMQLNHDNLLRLLHYENLIFPQDEAQVHQIKAFYEYPQIFLDQFILDL